jgi:hypothetical protein
MRPLRVIFIALAGIASAAVWAAPGDGITNTPHDFTINLGTTEPVGACTFCHTPHKAITTQLLWNHTLSTSNFAWDVASTTAGTTLPTLDGQTYNGVTTKCLSCHDGTVAIGDVGWWMEGKPAAPLNNKKHQPPNAANIAVGAAMAGNHPVAMPYPLGNAAGTYNGIATGAGATLDEWVADPTANGIRLFSDTGSLKVAGATAGRTGIECSSCHDPHNKQAVDDLFLRGTLTGNTGGPTGYICLKCHQK